MDPPDRRPSGSERSSAPRSLVGRTAPALAVAIALLVGGIVTGFVLDLRRDAASTTRPTTAGVSPGRSATASLAPQTVELAGVVDGMKAAQDLEQDVLFRVDEVLGTTLPAGFEPGVIQFTVTAGQAA